jgi:hypothetical protein
VDRLIDDVGRAYDRGIQVPGKEAHFLVLAAFLCSFGFIRTSAHMIRAEVSWWPGNVETKSGTHIHHLVWGILVLIATGYIGVAVAPGSPWRELAAIGFGIGLGLTLDEFALWLNLKDVYWEEQGRQSIDAVVVTAALLTIAVLGLSFWIDVYQACLVLLGFRGESAWILLPMQALAVCLAVVCVLKGRPFLAITGAFVPLVALFGALRPAAPGSRWLRHARPQASSSE